MLKYRGARELIFTIFIITLIHLLVFKVTEPRCFLEFFLYYATLGVSVLIYFKCAVSRMKSVRIGKFIVLAALIVVIYSIITVLASVFSENSRSLSQSLWGIFSIHSLTGIAMGLGIEAGEMINSRMYQSMKEI